MPTYYLSPHIRHCDVDQGAVVLNLRTEKYIAVPPPARDVLDSISRNASLDARDDESASEVMNALLSAGFITTTREEGALPRLAHLRPSESLFETLHGTAAPPLKWTDVTAFLAAYLSATHKLKRRPLDQVLRSLYQRKSALAATAGTREHAYLRQLVNTFRWLRLWTYTGTDRCLLDSLVLSEFLCRFDVVPTLVLGVQSKPFGAHAWVQSQDTILNDTIEKVSRYVPILAL
jgi:hypothetical protein